MTPEEWATEILWRLDPEGRDTFFTLEEQKAIIARALKEMISGTLLYDGCQGCLERWGRWPDMKHHRLPHDETGSMECTNKRRKS